MALARPMIKFCCQRLSTFFELDQKLAKFRTPQTPASHTPSSSMKTRQESHAESAAATEDDSVFDSTLSNIKHEPRIKIEPGTSTKHNPPETRAGRKLSSSRDRKHTATTPSSTLSDGEVPIITVKMEEEGGVSSANTGAVPSSYFHWCTHHQSLTLQFCCIIQTIAIRCPTAFVQTKVYIGRGISGSDGAKVTTPLSLLPMGLMELPMPRSLGMELQKKVRVCEW